MRTLNRLPTDRDMMVAKSLMYTCYQMYARTETGIAPEFVDFPEG